MKKKVFIIGAGPLPNDKEGIREAAGLRTHQFFSPIEKAGHDIFLFCIHNNVHVPKIQNIKKSQQTITIERGHRHDKTLKTRLRQSVDQFKPDVIVGVNTFPSFIASEICPTDTPLWSDCNGWIMAEAQARGFAEKTNTHFANAWRQEMSILTKSDKISTVSKAQKFATIGELAALGIMQIENFHEEKVFAFANASDSFRLDKDNYTNGESVEKDICTQNLFKGVKTVENAFIISWIGGYNNWVDEETLFTSLDNAMSKVSNLCFVSTGGAIKNVAEGTFARFKARIEKSKYKERYIFLGWIETEDMRKIYEESDAGINADFLCTETETGARNRLNEMLKFGLPIITTGGSEIAEEIGEYKAGISVKNEDSTALEHAIVSMANMTKEELETMKQRGKEMSQNIYNAEIILLPLLKFIQSPKKTILPALKHQSVFSFLQNIWHYSQKNSWKTIFAKIYQRIF